MSRSTSPRKPIELEVDPASFGVAAIDGEDDLNEAELAPREDDIEVQEETPEEELDEGLGTELGDDILSTEKDLGPVDAEEPDLADDFGEEV